MDRCALTDCWMILCACKPIGLDSRHVPVSDFARSGDPVAVIAGDQENSYGARAVSFWIAELKGKVVQSKSDMTDKAGNIIVQKGKSYFNICWYKATEQSDLLFEQELVDGTKPYNDKIAADSILCVPGLAWSRMRARAGAEKRKMQPGDLQMIAEEAKAEFQRSVEPYLDEDSADDADDVAGTWSVPPEQEEEHGEDDEEDEHDDELGFEEENQLD